MSAYDQQQEIVAELKKVMLGNTSHNVYEGSVDDGTKWTVEEGVSGKPFMAVNFAGFSQVPNKQKGITGAKFNSKDMVFTVSCIANTDGASRRLWDAMCARMIGFEPNNGGEIQEALYSTTGGINRLGSPTKYGAVQSFTFISNSFATC